MEIEGVKSQVKTSPIVADRSDSSDSDSALQEVETTPVEDSIAVNRPRREIRMPTRYTDMMVYALPIVDDDISVNFSEATKSSESTYWQVTMDDEMQYL